MRMVLLEAADKLELSVKGVSCFRWFYEPWSINGTAQR